MKNLKIVSVAASLVLCLLALTPAAKADEWDRLTYVTTSVPIEVPGMVLPAGKYIFQLVNGPLGTNIVEIRSIDGGGILTMIPAINVQYPTVPSTTVITLAERSEGTPPALSTWFYPGDDFGVQFVYPHS